MAKTRSRSKKMKFGLMRMWPSLMVDAILIIEVTINQGFWGFGVELFWSSQRERKSGMHNSLSEAGVQGSGIPELQGTVCLLL